MYRKSVVIITACLLCSVMQAQQSFVESFNLPQYDCEREQKVIMKIKKGTIVVPDDSTVVWVNPTCSYPPLIGCECLSSFFLNSDLCTTNFFFLKGVDL